MQKQSGTRYSEDLERLENGAEASFPKVAPCSNAVGQCGETGEDYATSSRHRRLE